VIKRKKLFVVFTSFLILSLLILGTLAWISAGYKRYIKSNLPAWVLKGTDSIYHASVEDISINIFTRRLTITGIKLQADTNCIQYHRETGKSNKVTVDLYVPKLQLNGIVWGKLLTNKEFSCNRAIIWQPKVIIISKYHEVDSSRIWQGKKESAEIKRLFATSIQIIQPDITFKSFNKDRDSFICRLNGGEGILNNWLLDDKDNDTTRFLLARSCIIDSSAFLFQKPSMLYAFKTRSFYFNTAKEVLSLQNISVAPTVSRTEYYRMVRHRTTICNASVSTMQFVDFKWQQLIHNNKLRCAAIHLTNPSVALYFSYLLPSRPANVVKYDPPIIIRAMPLKLDISDIIIHDGHVTYTELNEVSMQEGKLDLSKINCSVNNVTNIDTIIGRNNKLVAKANGKVYNTSDMSAVFTIVLSDTSGAFNIHANIKNVYASQINQVTRPLSLLQIDSLQLHTVNVAVDGNKNYTHSQVSMLYNNLKIKVEKPAAEDKLKSRPVISFLANTFFVYSDNPMPNGQLRTADTYLPRDVTTAFMPMIVKNVRQGMNKIMVRHEKLVAEITNDKTAKKEKHKRKGLFGWRK